MEEKYAMNRGNTFLARTCPPRQCPPLDPNLLHGNYLITMHGMIATYVSHGSQTVGATFASMAVCSATSKNFEVHYVHLHAGTEANPACWS